jgi:hypothetical protein
VGGLVEAVGWAPKRALFQQVEWYCPLKKRGNCLSIPIVTLRPEFRSAALKGTAIELATRNKTGATQIPASEFLNITYPSHDLIKALQAIGPHQDRPVVLIGERGIGKSHLMAALHHACTDPAATGCPTGRRH